jgi:hypothetical protein
MEAKPMKEQLLSCLINTPIAPFEKIHRHKKIFPVLMSLAFIVLVQVTQVTTVRAFDGDAAVITGDNVRVRSQAKAVAPVTATLRIGTVVRIIEKTGSRDKLSKGDAFGYYWYKVDAGPRTQGWVYGQFVYSLNGDRFVAENTLLYNPHRFSGKEWLFGVAVEPAYPVSDETGLTGSVIHAVPFFLDEKTNRAIFIQSEKVAYDLGEPAKPPALFRFNDSEGGTQKIQAIKIDQKTQAMTIEGFYETQVGGGKFILKIKINKDTLILAEFKKSPDKNN